MVKRDLPERGSGIRDRFGRLLREGLEAERYWSGRGEGGMMIWWRFGSAEDLWDRSATCLWMEIRFWISGMTMKRGFVIVEDIGGNDYLINLKIRLTTSDKCSLILK